jgi:hypothetical protein
MVPAIGRKYASALGVSRPLFAYPQWVRDATGLFFNASPFTTRRALPNEMTRRWLSTRG